MKKHRLELLLTRLLPLRAGQGSFTHSFRRAFQKPGVLTLYRKNHRYAELPVVAPVAGSDPGVVRKPCGKIGLASFSPHVLVAEVRFLNAWNVASQNFLGAGKMKFLGITSWTKVQTFLEMVLLWNVCLEKIKVVKTMDLWLFVSGFPHCFSPST